MLEQLLNILAPILICAGIGIGWKLSGIDYPSDFIGRLVMNIGAPCLIVHSLVSTDIDLQALSDVALVALLVLASVLVIGLGLLRVLGLNHRTYLPPLLFPNSGNMALPLCLFAFGQTGLALALGYFLTMMLAHLILGVLILEGTDKGIKSALINLLKQPMLYSMLLGLLFAFKQWTLPAWAANSVQLISGVTIPLMLITLGVALTSLKVGFWRRALLLSSFKLGLSLAVAFTACWWLGITGLPQKVIMVQAAMPAAVFNYLFAVRYRQQPDEVAGLVVASTLLSALFLPLLFTLLLAN